MLNKNCPGNESLTIALTDPRYFSEAETFYLNLQVNFCSHAGKQAKTLIFRIEIRSKTSYDSAKSY